MADSSVSTSPLPRRNELANLRKELALRSEMVKKTIREKLEISEQFAAPEEESQESKLRSELGKAKAKNIKIISGNPRTLDEDWTVVEFPKITSDILAPSSAPTQTTADAPKSAKNKGWGGYLKWVIPFPPTSPVFRVEESEDWPDDWTVDDLLEGSDDRNDEEELGARRMLYH